MWDVEFTDQFGTWWDSLTTEEQESLDAAVTILAEYGPGLRRPLVGHITASRHANMKELIPPGGAIRVLFAFDPRSHAILLIGGDKSGQWNRWYETAIPLADELYDEHLRELEREAGAEDP